MALQIVHLRKMENSQWKTVNLVFNTQFQITMAQFKTQEGLQQLCTFG